MGMNKELIKYIIDICQNDIIREELINKAIDGKCTDEELFVLNEVYSENINNEKPNFANGLELVDYTINESNMHNIYVATALAYTIGRHFKEYSGKTVTLSDIDEVLNKVLVDGTDTLSPKVSFMKQTIDGYVSKGDIDKAENFVNNFKCNTATLNKFFELQRLELENKNKRRSK